MFQQYTLDRLRAAMKREGYDVCVIREIENIMWLTGFERVFDDECAHRAVVTQDSCVIFTDSRYEDALVHAAEATSICVDAMRAALPVRVMRYICKSVPDAQSIAIEDSMPLYEYRAFERELSTCDKVLELVETSDFVLALRAQKTPSEIACLRAAQRITDEAFAHMVEWVWHAHRIEGKSLTEHDVQVELEQFMRLRGADGVAFESIVASGAHGAAPHSIPGGKIIEEGDMVVMDFGAKLNGYHSDMTRCMCFGEPSEKQARAYAAIRRANEEVEAMLKPGVTGAEAHNHAEAVLEQEGFGGCMGHSLGHGVGLQIHESPNLSPRNTKALEVGNVVTVEPGIYISDEFGCRLEDFGVVTEDGFVVFTQSPHELVII